MKRIALIDADSIIFKAGCANETREYHVLDKGAVVHRCEYKKEADNFVAGNQDLVVEKHKDVGDLRNSLSNAKNIIENIFDTLPAKEYQIYIGGKGNFRRGLYPEYKANRADSDRPLHEKQIREYLIDHWGAQEVHDEEADDRVSYIQCTDLSTHCIVGVDKDLWNTPGEHFNYDTGVLDFVEHEVANYNFWKQMLTGDRGDNIPGLPGIGPKKAEKIIKGPKANCAQEVLLAYRQNKKPLSYLTLMGRLLWLRRAPEELWTPSLMRKYTPL